MGVTALQRFKFLDVSMFLLCGAGAQTHQIKEIGEYNMTTQEKTLSKIQKLFNLAENNPSPEEEGMTVPEKIEALSECILDSIEAERDYIRCGYFIAAEEAKEMRILAEDQRKALRLTTYFNV